MSLSKEELESVLMYSRRRLKSNHDDFKEAPEFGMTTEFAKCLDHDTSLRSLDIQNANMIDDLIHQQIRNLEETNEYAYQVQTYGNRLQIYREKYFKENIAWMLNQKKLLCYMFCVMFIFWFNGMLFGAASCGMSKGRFVNPILNGINQYFIKTTGDNVYRAVV